MEGSIFTHKYTLVPKQFYSSATAETLIREVAKLEPDETVKSIALEELGAVLVYVVHESEDRNDLMPEAYHLLKSMAGISEYNKIICTFKAGYLHLLVAQGGSLLLLNSFKAEDFTTAEYFIFTVLKKFQLNPEMSGIYWRNDLTEEQRMSLYRYFKLVERI